MAIDDRKLPEHLGTGAASVPALWSREAFDGYHWWCAMRWTETGAAAIGQAIEADPAMQAFWNDCFDSAEDIAARLGRITRSEWRKVSAQQTSYYGSLSMGSLSAKVSEPASWPAWWTVVVQTRNGSAGSSTGS
jgi:hypothetical protein